MLLKNNETIENYLSIYEEYKKAYETRKAIIDNLYKEIKIIKKLKIWVWQEGRPFCHTTHLIQSLRLKHY